MVKNIKCKWTAKSVSQTYPCTTKTIIKQKPSLLSMDNNSCLWVALSTTQLRLLLQCPLVIFVGKISYGNTVASIANRFPCLKKKGKKTTAYVWNRAADYTIPHYISYTDILLPGGGHKDCDSIGFKWDLWARIMYTPWAFQVHTANRYFNRVKVA